MRISPWFSKLRSPRLPATAAPDNYSTSLTDQISRQSDASSDVDQHAVKKKFHLKKLNPQEHVYMSRLAALTVWTASALPWRSVGLPIVFETRWWSVYGGRRKEPQKAGRVIYLFFLLAVCSALHCCGHVFRRGRLERLLCEIRVVVLWISIELLLRWVKTWQIYLGLLSR